MAVRPTRRLYLLLPLVLALLACRLEPRHAGPPPKAKAPAFELTGHDGKRYSLEGLIAHGPAVVVFYRGFW